MDVITKEHSQEIVYEKCMRCNGDTPYTLADDIAGRKFYIDGYGQCCKKCYEELMQSGFMTSGEIEVPAHHHHHHAHEPAVAAPAQVTTLVMPYDYAENEHYYVPTVGKVQKKPLYSFLKRAFDLLVSMVAIILLSVFMLIIAIVVKVTSPGPVLYKQERLGLNGKRFTILKFRSMCQDAEKNSAMWSSGDNDVRITKIGHVLRKFRLDELPQLFCIFIGTMTFVGPRPERECFYREFEKHVHGFSERLKVKPGLTGLAQVNGGYDLSPQEKVKLDVEYIQKRSIGLDIKIIFKTVKIVFSHEGAR